MVMVRLELPNWIWTSLRSRRGGEIEIEFQLITEPMDWWKRSPSSKPACAFWQHAWTESKRGKGVVAAVGRSSCTKHRSRGWSHDDHVVHRRSLPATPARKDSGLRNLSPTVVINDGTDKWLAFSQCCRRGLDLVWTHPHPHPHQPHPSLSMYVGGHLNSWRPATFRRASVRSDWWRWLLQWCEKAKISCTGRWLHGNWGGCLSEIGTRPSAWKREHQRVRLEVGMTGWPLGATRRSSRLARGLERLSYPAKFRGDGGHHYVTWKADRNAVTGSCSGQGMPARRARTTLGVLDALYHSGFKWQTVTRMSMSISDCGQVLHDDGQPPQRRCKPVPSSSHAGGSYGECGGDDSRLGRGERVPWFDLVRPSTIILRRRYFLLILMLPFDRHDPLEAVGGKGRW